MASKSISDLRNEVAKLIPARPCRLRLIRDGAGSSSRPLSSESDPQADDVGTFCLYWNMKQNKNKNKMFQKERRSWGELAAAFPDETPAKAQFNKTIREAKRRFLNGSQPGVGVGGVGGGLRQQVGRCLISPVALSAFIKRLRGNGGTGRSGLLPPSGSALPLFPRSLQPFPAFPKTQFHTKRNQRDNNAVLLITFTLTRLSRSGI